MKKIILLIGVVLVLFFGCSKPDSKTDTSDRIKEITRLRAIERKMIASDSTLLYIAKIQKIIDSDKNLPDTLLIENLFRKGYYYEQIGVNDSATIYYHKTTDLVKKPNNRKRNSIYFRNAWLHDEDNEAYANAISLAEKFIAISDESKDYEVLVHAYNLLERLFYDLDDLEKKAYYNAKAIKAARESSNLEMLRISLNSKADILYNSEQKEEAYQLLDSLSSIKIESQSVLAELYRNHGNLYYKDSTYKLAVKKYKKALQYSRNDNDALLEVYNYIAASNIELEEYKVAKQYLDSSKAIINNKSLPEYVLYNKELYLRLNYRTKADEEEFIIDYNKLIDDNKKERKGHIDEKLRALIIANNKEKQAILEKNNADLRSIKLIVLLIFSGLLMLLGYLFYRQRRHKFEKQDMQMEQRLLRSQMNPHFMFNTLSAIQNQIKDNQEHAANYLLKFSRLLRLILENSLSNYVQIENELELLRKYIELQLLRFPEKFTYTIELEGLEEDELLFIPPMLIQPFVENSIEHGFIGIEKKGHINIKLALLDKWIACTIEDDGAGLNHLNNNYKKSVSTKLISQFIYKTTRNKITILDKKKEDRNTTGVLVKFLIPYKFSKDD